MSCPGHCSCGQRRVGRRVNNENAIIILCDISPEYHLTHRSSVITIAWRRDRYVQLYQMSLIQRRWCSDLCMRPRHSGRCDDVSHLSRVYSYDVSLAVKQRCFWLLYIDPVSLLSNLWVWRRYWCAMLTGYVLELKCQLCMLHADFFVYLQPCWGPKYVVPRPPGWPWLSGFHGIVKFVFVLKTMKL